jgi:hypothetical protein
MDEAGHQRTDRNRAWAEVESVVDRISQELAAFPPPTDDVERNRQELARQTYTQMRETLTTIVERIPPGHPAEAVAVEAVRRMAGEALARLRLPRA